MLDYFELTRCWQVARIARPGLLKSPFNPEAESFEMVYNPFEAVVVKVGRALDLAVMPEDLAILGLIETEFFFAYVDESYFLFRNHFGRRARFILTYARAI